MIAERLGRWALRVRLSSVPADELGDQVILTTVTISLPKPIFRYLVELYRVA